MRSEPGVLQCEHGSTIPGVIRAHFDLPSGRTAAWNPAVAIAKPGCRHRKRRRRSAPSALFAGPTRDAAGSSPDTPSEYAVRFGGGGAECEPRAVTRIGCETRGSASGAHGRPPSGRRASSEGSSNAKSPHAGACGDSEVVRDRSFSATPRPSAASERRAGMRRSARPTKYWHRWRYELPADS